MRQLFRSAPIHTRLHCPRPAGPLLLTLWLFAGVTFWGARAHAQPAGRPGIASVPPAAARSQVMEALVVTAARAPQSPEHVAATVELLSGDELRRAPTATIDGALRSIPVFSLFRRSDSFTANPTAQGVSLRGLGPSGASRSLVLLDGIPLNDPFGGWIAWTKLPREGIARAEIVPGGGATAWGNAALGGVVQLFTADRATPADSATASGLAARTGPSLRFSALAGDYGTRSGELALSVPAGRGVVEVLGRAFSTDGFGLVAPEHRGPVDMPAWSRHRWLTLRWHQPLGAQAALLATARVFEEKRGNGTPYQGNDSREKFISVALADRVVEQFGWNATAYAQTQSFASTFGAVNADRTTETPASDQFDVPSSAFGAAWTGLWRHADEARTSFGADARFVRGETREHYLYTAGDFTRLRVAGGKQLVGGVFALHERALGSSVRGTIGARFDGWNESDGHRRESDRATGVLSRDDRYADRDGTSFGPSAGLVWTPAAAWRVRANAQRGFRRPTLNELYRPFRIGSNITEANAALGTERVTSTEVSVEWSLVRPNSGTGGTNGAPLRRLTLGATTFHNDLRDAVGNVTLIHGPIAHPLFGFVPANGVGRQRLNLDRTRVRGVELSAAWMPTNDFALSVDYLRNDARVQHASIAPALAGKRVAQVPRDSAAVTATWRAPGGIVVAPRMRWIGRQFEDDENQLILGEVVIADVTATRALTANLELFITLENLGDARIETGRNAGGLVHTGTPRLFLGGVRGSW